MAVAVDLDISSLVSFVADIDVAALPNGQLAQLVIQAEALLNAAHALSAVALEEYQRQGTWANEGALSGAGWAADRTGSPRRTLRARVRCGMGLRLLPGASAAAGRGD
jgi:hypothetical protein